MITLRDYQQDLYNRVRASAKAGNKRIIAVAPTGAGKTVWFCYLAMKAAQNGARILFVAHRDTLIKQISETLTEFNVRHGLIMPGMQLTSNPIQVGTKDTLVNRIKTDTNGFYKFDIVIIDECHHMSHGSGWHAIAMHNYDSFHIGATATPCRLDSKPLGRDRKLEELGQPTGWYDDMVVGPTPLDLMNHPDGPFLLKPIYYRPEPENVPGIDERPRGANGDFSTTQLDEFMNTIGKKTYGDSLKIYKKVCDGAPAMAFCASVKHAHLYAEEFKKAGYQAAVVVGETKDRDRIFADLADGKLNVVVGRDVFTEGTDVKCVKAVFMQRYTNSFSLVRQMEGRAMRTYKDDRHCYVIDTLGLSHKHGLFTDPVEWSLHSKPKAGRKPGEVDPAKQCPDCGALDPEGLKCPDCGKDLTEQPGKEPDKVAERQNVDMELTELNAFDRSMAEYEQIQAAEDLKRSKRAAARNSAASGKRVAEMNRSELIAYGREMGYKNPSGWAHVQLKNRKGENA